MFQLLQMRILLSVTDKRNVTKIEMRNSNVVALNCLKNLTETDMFFRKKKKQLTVIRIRVFP